MQSVSHISRDNMINIESVFAWLLIWNGEYELDYNGLCCDLISHCRLERLCYVTYVTWINTFSFENTLRQ